MKVSIVMPAYNEEKRIGKTLEAYRRFFNAQGKKDKFSYQILVVINGTTDNTEKVVKSYRKKDKHVAYIVLKRGGKGYALTEGFKKSLAQKYDVIGFVDADMATPPEQYYRLVRSLNSVDGAIADRYMNGSKITPQFSFRRVIVSRTFNFLVRSLFAFQYNDTQCGAKVFKKNVIEQILPELVLTNWAYDINLLHACKEKKFTIRSVPTVWYEIGGSKLNIPKVSMQMFFSVIQLRILKSPFRPFLKVIKPIVKAFYQLLSK